MAGAQLHYCGGKQMPRSSILRVNFLAPFVVCLSAFTFAQTVVDGSVHDRAGAPVAGASVKLTRENGSVAESASTAADAPSRAGSLDGPCRRRWYR